MGKFFKTAGFTPKQISQNLANVRARYSFAANRGDRAGAEKLLEHVKTWQQRQRTAVQTAVQTSQDISKAEELIFTKVKAMSKKITYA